MVFYFINTKSIFLFAKKHKIIFERILYIKNINKKYSNIIKILDRKKEKSMLKEEWSKALNLIDFNKTLKENIENNKALFQDIEIDEMVDFLKAYEKIKKGEKENEENR